MDKYIGKTFGKLQVIERVESAKTPSGSIHARYLCKCSCGKTKIVRSEHLISGATRSCGCLMKEGKNATHREGKTRLYRIWGNMVNRCTNKNNPVYNEYGGRGITVCDEWRNNYIAFREWAYENGYNDELTIDRIDNNHCYCPENCRWADRIVQANNKRINVFVNLNGEVHTIAEWSKISGIPYKTLHARLTRSKWSFYRAITEPLKQNNKPYIMPNENDV